MAARIIPLPCARRPSVPAPPPGLEDLWQEWKRSTARLLGHVAAIPAAVLSYRLGPIDWES